MRASAALKSLIHGVSTDAALVAEPIYLLEQDNVQTVVGSGLRKRPPTEAIVIGVEDVSGNPSYVIGTDTVIPFQLRDILYFIRIRNVTPGTEQEGDITVLDQSGNVYDVSTDQSIYAYLYNTARNNIHISTHGDTAFITNSERTVKMLPDLRPNVTTTLVRVAVAPELGQGLSLAATDDNVTTTTALYTVPTAAGSNAVNSVCQNLVNAFNTAATGGEVAAAYNDTMSITYPSGKPASVTVSDPTVLNVIGTEIESLDYLPRYGIPNKTVAIRKEHAPIETAFYMRAILDKAKPEVQFAGQITGNLIQNSKGTWGTYTAGSYTTSVARWGLGGRYSNTSLWGSPYAFAGTGNAGNFETEQIGVIEIAQAGYWLFGIPSNIGKLYIWPKFRDTGFVLNTMTRFTMIDTETGQIAIDKTMLAVSNPHGTGYYFESSTNCTVAEFDALRSGKKLDTLINYSGNPTQASSMASVTWEESSKPEEEYKLDPTTMPHRLVPNVINGELTFTLGTVNWDDKHAGNSLNNPEPPFVGHTITESHVFQNRLTTLTEDEISTSETDNINSFFRNTVTQELPTQPVSLRSTVGSSSNFTSAMNHNKDLMVFNRKAQFKLAGDKPLTPQTSALPQISGFRSITNIKPMSLGDKVYFAYSYGKSFGVSRYEQGSIQTLSDTFDPLTEHVKGYLPTDISMRVGDASTGTLILANNTTLFVCDFDTDITRAETKRFAWSKWYNFAGLSNYSIEAIALAESTLYLMIAHDGILDLVSLDLTIDIESTQTYTYLDNQVTGTLNASWELPGTDNYVVDADTNAIYADGADIGRSLLDDGYTIQNAAGTNNIELVGVGLPDLENVNIIVGKYYNAKLTPPKIIGRDEGDRVNSSTNIRVLHYLVHLERSADVSATINSPYATFPDQYWSGLISGDSDTKTDTVANETNAFKVSFKQRGDLATMSLHSKGYLPMNVTEIEWIGNYISRGRRF